MIYLSLQLRTICNKFGVYTGGDTQKGKKMTLEQLVPGSRARIIDVHGGRGLCRHLEQMGLHRGDILSLKGTGAFRGPVLIEVHGSQIALGRGVARRVIVEPV